MWGCFKSSLSFRSKTGVATRLSYQITTYVSEPREENMWAARIDDRFDSLKRHTIRIQFLWYILITGLLSVKGKVREFLKKSGKIIDVVKVSEKSGNSVFRFIVHKSSSRFWNAFSFGKDEKYAAKQARRSIWHSTPDTCISWGQWFSLSRKEVENEEKNIDGLQKKQHRLFLIDTRSVKTV